MKLMSLKTGLAAAALTFGTAASAAGAFCPGDINLIPTQLPGAGYVGTTTAGAPTGGDDAPAGYTRYVFVEGGLVGSSCYYRSGNLDTPQSNLSPPPKPPKYNGWEDFSLSDGPGGINLSEPLKYESAQAPGGGLITFVNTKPYSFTLNGVDFSNPVYIGFHFGGGGGDPDSYIVQLDKAFFTNGSGESSFAYSSTQGLSNIYFWGTACKPGDIACEGEEVPEPGTLALLGAGLAGLALIRRRRRN